MIKTTFKRAAITLASLLLMLTLIFLGANKGHLLEGRFRMPALNSQITCGGQTLKSPDYDVLVDTDTANLTADFFSLSDAIAASPNNTKIVLCPGSYYTYADIEDKKISIFGVGANPSATKILPDTTAAAFQPSFVNGTLNVYNSTGWLELANVQIGGKPNLNGILVENGAHLKMTQSTLAVNMVAITASTGADIDISDSTFKENSVDITVLDGTEIDVDNTRFISTNSQISLTGQTLNGIFILLPRNQGQRPLSGYSNASKVKYENCIFKKYPVLMGVDFLDELTLKNTTIEDSTIAVISPSAKIRLSKIGKIEFNNLTFRNNKAHYEKMIEIGSSETKIINSRFIDNVSGSGSSMFSFWNDTGVQSGIEGSKFQNNLLQNPPIQFIASIGIFLDPAIILVEPNTTTVTAKNSVFKNNSPQSCTGSKMVDAGGNVDADQSCLP